MAIDYKQLVAQAVELVDGVEEPYKGLAFQVILQHLITESRPESIEPPTKVGRRVSREEEKDPTGVFMDRAVDASAYTPLFFARGRLVEKSLAVLLLARDELGIDGMTASQIAEVLTKKFRVPMVHARNISRDLSRRTEYVSRVRTAEGYKYLLMLGGEKHLAGTLSE